jgi:hypothetical protein
MVLACLKTKLSPSVTRANGKTKKKPGFLVRKAGLKVFG